jgi:hypothetical protein
MNHAVIRRAIAELVELFGRGVERDDRRVVDATAGIEDLTSGL